MDTNKKVQFQHALIKGTDIIVDIESVTEEDRKNHTYKCPCCDDDLIPALGKKNAHHFRHKEGKVCNHETYLHKISKLYFKQRFNSDKPLYIEYSRIVNCSEIETCKACHIEPNTNGIFPIYESLNGCKRCINERCNLKDYYDTCLIEEPIGNFKADVLLKDSTGKCEPLLIEILVTHECTDDKKNSGLAILEIPITSEADAEGLLSIKCLYGTQFNFKIPEAFKKLTYSKDVNIYRMFKSGCYIKDSRIMECGMLPYEHDASAIFEFSSEFNISAVDVYKIANNSGIAVNNCCLCEHSTYDGITNRCKEYKDFGTPYNPSNQFANKCKYYICQKRISSFYDIKILYLEQNESERDCIGFYNNIYSKEVENKCKLYMSMFKQQGLCFKLSDREERFYLHKYYDTANVIKDEDGHFYGLEFRSSKKPKYGLLRIILVRESAFIRDLSSFTKTIYAYDKTVRYYEHEICIYENTETNNFRNFLRIQPKEDNRPFY